jgi:cellulose synthase/poly-beta-1,6-N-acetylglucosamine synthase-like glycosyltransferase
MGIMAHNEGANLGRLLENVVSQRMDAATLTQIVVVASGCTDDTEAIVKAWAKREPRIHLLVQECREGKASAVNYFLSHTREKILVLCSADLVPASDAIEKVVAPFADPEVAMTSCRLVPTNDPNRFMGFAAHLLWNLHHLINFIDFKAGELIAFRRIFERIPRRTAVDEASIESIIRGQGYTVQYVGAAVVYNKGPDTIDDFIRQRRRIYAGHLALRDNVGYRVATLNGINIVRLVIRHLDRRPRAFLWTWAVATLEAYGRFLGWYDYKRRRDHSIWQIAGTTKRPDTSAIEQPANGHVSFK